MKEIGLTGNIGSGKSTVAEIFKIIGIPVFSADAIGKQALNRESNKEKLISVFGNTIFSPDKTVNKKKLASIVFSDKHKLEELNNIIHPIVRSDYQQWLKNHTDKKYILHEAAILIESGFYTMFEKIILVTSPEKLRTNRVMKRDGTDLNQIKERMNNQMKESDKTRYADYIIKNNEDDMLIPQVLEIHKSLII